MVVELDEGVQDEAWESRYEFAGTKLGNFPLPARPATGTWSRARRLAQQLAVASTTHEDERIRGRMIALQEELDWDVYHRYGLITDEQAAELVATPGSVPNLDLGQRAFEIVMARRMERGELETQWFARHRSVPITEIPKEWPEEYRRVVERRIEVIESNRNIGLIERPECKRRWQSPSPGRFGRPGGLPRGCWTGARTAPSGTTVHEPRPMTVNRLADRLRADAEVVAVARQLKGPDADLADVLKEIIADEHVPFLAALPLQAVRPGQARPVGAHLGPAARGGRDRQAPGHPGPAEVRQRRLPEAVLLAPPRQARRAQGALHLLPGREPRQRQGLPAHRLGRLGPQGPGHRPDRPDRGPQHHGRLGHRPPDPPAGRPSWRSCRGSASGTTS